MALTLLLAVGATLIVVTTSETSIASNYRAGGEALYAADAVLQRAIGELRGVANWTQLPDGSVRASFTDGAPIGTRRLSDGSAIDLSEIVNLARCGKRGACTGADMSATTMARPWGVNNPQWTLYAYGWLADLAGGDRGESPYYVVAMVADDGAEIDGDPARDGGSVGELANPGKNILLIRAEAFGPRGAHRAIEAVLSRYQKDELDPASPFRIRLQVWRAL